MSRNASKSTRRRGHRRHTLSRNRRKTFRSKYMIGNGAAFSVCIEDILERDLDVSKMQSIFESGKLKQDFHMIAPQGGTCYKTIINIMYHPESGDFFILTSDDQYYHLGEFIKSHRGYISINFSIKDIKHDYIRKIYTFLSENRISDATLSGKGLGIFRRTPVKITYNPHAADPKWYDKTPEGSKLVKKPVTEDRIDQTRTVPFTPTQLFR